MSTGIWIYVITAGVGLGGLALFLFATARRGLSSSQAREIDSTHQEEREAIVRAEDREEADLERNAKEAQTSLRHIQKDQEKAKEPWVGQTEEEIETEAREALRRWEDTNKSVQSALLIGLWVLAVVIMSWSSGVRANTLTTTQRLTKALNDCTFTLRRERVTGRKQLADAHTRCKRKTSIRDAKIQQLQRELLTYRKRPKSDVGLIVGMTVLGGVAIIAVGVAISAIVMPEWYGNRRP